jgi:hypothetical protein
VPVQIGGINPTERIIAVVIVASMGCNLDSGIKVVNI